MAFNCDNCGSSLSGAVIERGIRFTACPACGSLHNMNWLQCRADGKAYLQPPIRLPASTLIGRNEAGLVITVHYRNKVGMSDWLIGGAAVAVFGGIGVACILFGPMPVGIALCVFTSLLLLAGVAETVWPNRFGVELVATAAGVSLLRLQRHSKVLEFELPWSEIRLVDPYCKPYPGIRNAEIYGIKLIKKDGTEQEILSSIATPEHSLFLAYHLQRELEARSAAPAAKPAKASKPTRARTLLDLRMARANVAARGELECSQCGAPFVAERIFKERKAALCTYCGAVEELAAETFKGDAELEFPKAFTYVHDRTGLRLQHGEEPKPNEESGLGEPISALLVVSLLCAGMSYAIFESAWALLACPIVIGLGSVAIVLTAKYRVTPVRAERIAVNAKGVVFAENHGLWVITARVAREQIKNVRAYVDTTGKTDYAVLVFIIEGGDSLTTFELPTPWHARQVVREIKELLGLPV